MPYEIPLNPTRGQKYQFLALKVNGAVQKRPTRPWSIVNYSNSTYLLPAKTPLGDIPSYDGTSKIEFVETEAADEVLSWVCDTAATATEGPKFTLDMNCLVNVSPNDLIANSLMDGGEFTIGQNKLRIGCPDGGTYGPSPVGTSSAAVGNNHWDDIVANKAGVEGIPAATATDNTTKYKMTADQYDTALNQFWNFAGCWSIMKNKVGGTGANSVVRGCHGVLAAVCITPSYRFGSTGFRPRLEVLITAPRLTDSLGDTPNMGDQGAAFSHTFTATDGGGGEFSLDVKLDNTESLLSLANQTTGEHTVTLTADQWAGLAYGQHTIDITATDGSGRTATRNISFRRTFPAPAITGLTTGRRILESGEIEFTDSQEPNGPAITYEVEMATDAAFTAGLLTFPGTAGECKAAYSGLVTKTEYYARAVGISGTERRPGAAIKVKAGKTGTITLAPLEPQPNSRPDHGQPYVRGIVPAGATVTVEVCNNANDASPAWEDATATALAGSGAMHVFANQTKTAATWAYGMRALLDAGTSTEPIKITEMGR